MERIGVGVIGAGGIAALLHLPQLDRIADFEIRLLAGRKRHRLQTLAERYGGRISTDYQEVIEAADVEAVVVATPHPLHVEWGVRALEAGKHLLMQKPLAGTLADADRFAESAERARGAVVCLPHFAPDVIQARRLIDAGRLGVVSGAYCRTSHGGPEVYYAEVRDAFGERDTDLWFFDAKRASVGALFDMGVYAIAQLVTVLGSVTAVEGRVGTVAKPTELEDSASLLLEFERGCVATAETSWCDAARTWTLSVHGTEARLQTGSLGEPALTLFAPTSHTRENAPINVEDVALDDVFRGNAHELWGDAIRTGTQPEFSNWQSARHVTEILLAGLESSRRRRPVEVYSRV